MKLCYMTCHKAGMDTAAEIFGRQKLPKFSTISNNFQL